MHAPGMLALFRASRGYPEDVCAHDASYSPAEDVAGYQSGWEAWLVENPVQAGPEDTWPEGETLTRYLGIIRSRELTLKHRRASDHLRRRRPPVSGEPAGTRRTATSSQESAAAAPAATAAAAPSPPEVSTEDEELEPVVHA
jgi:hypothetical protein